MILCQTCGEEILTGCGCSVTGGSCFDVAGSGSVANPISVSSVLDADPQNLASCSATGLLVQLPPAVLAPPSCQAFNSAAQSIPDSFGTVVALDSERYDTDTMHDNVTNNSRITFKTAGIYVVTFLSSWAANLTGDRQTNIRKNGSDFLGLNARKAVNSASIETGQGITIQEFFEVGEYVEALVKQDSGGALNLLATRYSPILSARYRRGAP